MPCYISLVARWFGRVEFRISVCFSSGRRSWKTQNNYSKFDLTSRKISIFLLIFIFLKSRLCFVHPRKIGWRYRNTNSWNFPIRSQQYEKTPINGTSCFSKPATKRKSKKKASKAKMDVTFDVIEELVPPLVSTRYN